MTPSTRKEMYLSRIATGEGAVPTPATREEMYLAKIAGEEIEVPTPATRVEMYLYKIAGGSIIVPAPATRLEMFLAAASGMPVATPVPATREEMLWDYIINGTNPQTITGVPPISFTGNGKPLISWSMLGNGQQTGTPTPDAPIMPDFCGVRTGNLAWTGWAQDFETRANNYSLAHVGTDGSRTYLWYNVSVGYQDYDNKYIFKTDFKPNTQYTFCFEGMRPEDQNDSTALRIQYTDDTTTNCYIYSGGGYRKYAFTSEAGKTVKYIRAAYTSGVLCIDINTFMCVEGTTAPATFIPYGFQIPITCTEQTTPVYLGQVQTVRRIRKLVLTGDEYWAIYEGTNRFFYTTLNPKCAAMAAKYFLCTHRTGLQAPSSKDSLRWYDIDTDWQDVTSFKTWLATQYAAGTPVTVWYALATPETGIFNEPLCKIGDYADELRSEDAGVTIPTANGANVLTVDTDLQPSSMTITGYIAETQTMAAAKIMARASGMNLNDKEIKSLSKKELNSILKGTAKSDG